MKNIDLWIDINLNNTIILDVIKIEEWKYNNYFALHTDVQLMPALHNSDKIKYNNGIYSTYHPIFHYSGRDTNWKVYNLVNNAPQLVVYTIPKLYHNGWECSIVFDREGLENYILHY